MLNKGFSIGGLISQQGELNPPHAKLFGMTAQSKNIFK